MGIDWKMFLTPEMRAGVSVLEGEDLDKVLLNYGVSSVGGELGGGTDTVDAATKQFADAGMVSPGATDALGNVPQEQLYNDAINIPTTAQYPQEPTIQNSGLQDSGIVGQGGQVKLGDNAITGPQFDNYPTTSPANLPEPEAPGTFLGLEGKDYTKMGMQGVLAAGVSAAQPTPIQPSKAPAGPGMTKGNPIPQNSMQGVNSMVNPVQPLNSMQMTQAQGLISPFQRDRMRRGQY